MQMYYIDAAAEVKQLVKSLFLGDSFSKIIL